MAKGYSIMVGRERPETVFYSSFDRTTKQPVGDKVEYPLSVGTHLIINRCDVWGRRIATDKTGKQIREADRIEVTDTDYRGQLEFLKWGDPKGYLVPVRYLQRSNSLDVTYQELIQKIVVNINDPRDEKEIYIDLDSGENRFDEEKNPLFVQLLKIHPSNRNSVSKNPDPKIKTEQFYEIKDGKIENESLKLIEDGLDAGIFVKEVSQKGEEALKNLFDVISKGSKINEVDSLSVINKKYAALLHVAKETPDIFFMNLNDYKRNVSDTFEKAKALNLFDLTKNGVIAYLNDSKKEVLIEGANGKGEQMLEWALENFYNDGVYENIKHFIHYVSNIK